MSLMFFGLIIFLYAILFNSILQLCKTMNKNREKGDYSTCHKIVELFVTFFMSRKQK